MYELSLQIKNWKLILGWLIMNSWIHSSEFELTYVPYKIVNRAYTLNSSLDFHLLFENVTTYNYKISYTSS